nr:O-antigen ligase family protein [Neobacillus sp. Marseille-Q6967]
MLIKYALFLLPFVHMFRFQLFLGNEQIYIAVFILAISFISILLFMKYILIRQRTFPKGNVLYLFLILYMFLSFIYLKYKFMLISGLSLLIVYMAILILSEYLSFKRLFWNMYRYYSLGIVFLCLVMQVVVDLELLGMTFIDNRFGWVLYEDITVSDPNYFAVFIGLAMIYFYFIFSNRQEKNGGRFLHLILFLASGYFLTITLSRGVVFSLIITLVLVSIIKEWGKIKFVMASCMLPLVLTLGWILLHIFGSNNVENVNFSTIQRFLLLNSSDRIAVWTSIFNGFRNSGLFTVLFGNGFQSGSSIGAKFYLGVEPQSNGLIFKNPHNMFLQLLVEIGVLGMMILLTIALMYLWQTFKNMQRNNYVPLALLLFFCSVNLSLNVMGFREQALIFGILLLASIRTGGSANEMISRERGKKDEVQLNNGDCWKKRRSEKLYSVS